MKIPIEAIRSVLDRAEEDINHYFGGGGFADDDLGDDAFEAARAARAETQAVREWLNSVADAGLLYHRDDVEAALCVWEWVLETQPPVLTAIGAAATRLACIEIGRWVEKVYQAYGPDNFDDSFDWEFVPAAMRFVEMGETIFTPPVAEVVAKLKEQFAND